MPHGPLFFIFIAVVFLLILGANVAAAASDECHFTTQRVQCGDHTCKANKCVLCTVNADCYEEGMHCDGGLCKLKPLADNMGLGTVIAAVISFIVCCVGIVAGVGGGGILVPMFSVLLSLPVSYAVAVSQLTIVGQSLFSFTFIVGRRHDSDSSRPLVNYQYLSLLMPMAIAGTSVGVQLGRVLPDIARIVLLICTFVALLRRLIGKAVDQFRKATGAKRLGTSAVSAHPMPKSESSSEVDMAMDGPLPNPEPEVVAAEARPSGAPTSPSLSTQTAAKALPVVVAPATGAEAPSSPVPVSLRQEVAIVVLSVVMLLIGAISRQSATCGTALYGVLSVGPLVGLLIVFGYAYARLRRRVERFTASEEGGAGERPQGHVAGLHFSWNQTTSILFPIIAIGAGAAASMLGIGGGLILGFLLFEAGLTPQESSATSATATLLVAGESVIQLAMTGMVQLDYACLFLLVGGLSGFVGQTVLMTQIRKRGLHYLIIAALTLIVAMSMICLVSLAVYQAAVGLKESGGSLIVWGSFCKRSFVVEDTAHG